MLSAIYDFCLNWQMGYSSRTELIREFNSIGISFADFKKIAQTHQWYVPSMESLAE